ncbi:hypothetical protein BH20ACT6_BH20ACT6_12930 [soil metagenome]
MNPAEENPAEENRAPVVGVEEQVEAQLAALDHTPVDQHVPIYESVHRALDGALGAGTGTGTDTAPAD